MALLMLVELLVLVQDALPMELVLLRLD